MQKTDIRSKDIQHRTRINSKDYALHAHQENHLYSIQYFLKIHNTWYNHFNSCLINPIKSNKEISSSFFHLVFPIFCFGSIHHNIYANFSFSALSMTKSKKFFLIEKKRLRSDHDFETYERKIWWSTQLRVTSQKMFLEKLIEYIYSKFTSRKLAGSFKGDSTRQVAYPLNQATDKHIIFTTMQP